MAKTLSTMLELGTVAPDFRLKNTEGESISLDSFKNSAAYLIFFTCNHCPYVIHIRECLNNLCRTYKQKGVAVVGINSNDVENYPADSPEMMIEEVKKYDLIYDYLFDESQEVAKQYGAACTPDFYLFDASRSLVYRGQMDGSRPGNSVENDGSDLEAAMKSVLAGQPIVGDQKPSMGCNIKWKPGCEPSY